MSRSGYSESCDDNWNIIRWRGQVMSAIRGKRGQAFLRELIDALEAMPEKRLISKHLRKDGEVCALGAVGAKRGMNLESLDPEDFEILGTEFGIAHQLVQEIEFLNDEGCCGTPEQRWESILAWAKKHLAPPVPNSPPAHVSPKASTCA